MAEINRESQELAEIMAQVNREMRLYGELTKETSDKRKDAEIAAQFGLKNFTAASEKGADAVINLGKAMGQAASSMYQGKKGAAAFNDSVDSLTTAAKAAAAGLLLLGGPLGLLAAAVMGGIAALGKYTQAANEMTSRTKPRKAPNTTENAKTAQRVQSSQPLSMVAFDSERQDAGCEAQ